MTTTPATAEPTTTRPSLEDLRLHAEQYFRYENLTMSNAQPLEVFTQDLLEFAQSVLERYGNLPPCSSRSLSVGD